MSVSSISNSDYALRILAGVGGCITGSVLEVLFSRRFLFLLNAINPDSPTPRINYYPIQDAAIETFYSFVYTGIANATNNTRTDYPFFVGVTASFMGFVE